jgi:hypothetical protein
VQSATSSEEGSRRGEKSDFHFVKGVFQKRGYWKG